MCRTFVNFGVPFETSSDVRPESFVQVTKDFIKRWGIHHRVSSAYGSMSNGRTELAVKATKELLMKKLPPND